MKLPELPVDIPHRENQVYQLQGLDRTDDYNDGSLIDCKNISSLRRPYYTTRYARNKDFLYQNATAISAWDSLLVVDGGRLLYGGVDRGPVIDGDKQFAVINTKIVIFPDKKYLDLNTLTIVDMVNEETISGTLEVAAENETQTITVSGGWSTYGERIQSEYNENNQRDEVTVTIGDSTLDLVFHGATQSNTDLVLTFGKDDYHILPSGTYSTMVMLRKIPDFDFICSANNRIWGCESKTQSIFASALGDPKSFFMLGTDLASSSWVTNVATPGEFTGCASLGSSVVFFKEYCIHKVLGSTPADYSLYTYDMDGVKKGCHKSIQNINDTLYYLSNRGVMVFSGGNTTKISEALGKTPLSNGVAGTDGERYYLYCDDGGDAVFTYDFKSGVWLKEEDRRVVGFTRLNNLMYMIIDGKVYSSTANALDEEWYLQFNDISENIFNNYGNRTGRVLNKKYYSRLILKVEMGKDSYATVLIRFDGGRWTEAGKIAGKSGVFTQVIPINRCDKFGIKIEGYGEFSLIAMSREYVTRSVRNE